MGWVIVVGGAAGVLIGLACGMGSAPGAAEIVPISPVTDPAPSTDAEDRRDAVEPALVTMERERYGEEVPVGLGLCGPAERTWFTCPIADSPKLVSLCGEPSALRYRFGRPDAVELELERPAERGPRVGGRMDVAGVQYLIAGGGMTKLATVDLGTADAAYVVQDRFRGSASPESEPEGFIGLRVTPAEGEPVELPCRTGAESHHIRQLYTSLPE